MEQEKQNWYSFISIMFFNTVIFLIVLNLVLGLIIYPLVDAFRARADSSETVVNHPLEYDEDLIVQVYPSSDLDAIRAMLTEMWTRNYICSPYTHYREAPYSGEYVNVSELGFRLIYENQTMSLSDDVYTIFVLGGSTTFGYGVADSETIPAYLAGYLEEDRAVEVYNFGQGTYYSSMEVALLQGLLRSGYIPDMVIMIDGLNDGLHQTTGIPDAKLTRVNCGSPTITSNRISVMQSLSHIQLPMDRLLTSIQYRAGLAQPAPDNQEHPYAGTSLTLDETIHQYRSNVGIVQSLGETFGFETIFVLQPVPVYNYDLDSHLFMDSDAGLTQVTAFYEQVASSYEDWDNTLWLGDIQLDIHEPLYVDRVHYTAAFNNVIATRIADYIRNSVPSQ